MILNELDNWLASDFKYDEWGRGARIWIISKSGKEYLFADFENHLDAECFLDLIEGLKKNNVTKKDLQ